MLSTETLITFSIASVLLSFAPGPDNIFVLMQSVMHGRKAGIMVTLGLCTGLLGHTLAVTLGMAAIFQVSAFAFMALKILGVFYLLYLAWQAFLSGSEGLSNSESPKLSNWQLYKRGAFMSTANPKLAIFFMAFLPQFADPSRGSLSMQLLLLGLIFIFIGFMVMSLIAVLSGSISECLRRSGRVQNAIHKLAGIVFVGLALKLVTTEK
ncbi:MAG: LysE family translocator [Neptuniibacter sp.]